MDPKHKLFLYEKWKCRLHNDGLYSAPYVISVTHVFLVDTTLNSCGFDENRRMVNISQFKSNYVVSLNKQLIYTLRTYNLLSPNKTYTSLEKFYDINTNVWIRIIPFLSAGASFTNIVCLRTGHGPLARYVKLRVAHAPGLARTFSPPPRVSDPDMHHGTYVTHVTWCMPGSLNSRFHWSRWQRKRSRHSRRMRINPQFYVSSKRPMDKQLDSKDNSGMLLLIHAIFDKSVVGVRAGINNYIP